MEANRRNVLAAITALADSNGEFNTTSGEIYEKLGPGGATLDVHAEMIDLKKHGAFSRLHIESAASGTVFDGRLA